MTAYTDDDVTAVVKVLDSWGIRKQIEDIAANVLAAVAPAIAARARREAADVPCRFCHTPASTHDVTSCPRHFYHPELDAGRGEQR